MKDMKFVLSTVIGIAISSFCLVGCASNDDDSPSQDPVVAAATVIQGQWFVTSYSEDGTVKTDIFQGNSFSFQSDGAVKVTKGGVTLSSGTWKVMQDSGKLKLLLTLSGGSYFEEISEDWEIVSATSSVLSLKSSSGGSGATSLLAFGR
jgi:hypothetical protein